VVSVKELGSLVEFCARNAGQVAVNSQSSLSGCSNLFMNFSLTGNDSINVHNFG
jgi:hypothetical protein